jgi:hypothetical protein
MHSEPGSIPATSESIAFMESWALTAMFLFIDCDSLKGHEQPKLFQLVAHQRRGF